MTRDVKPGNSYTNVVRFSARLQTQELLRIAKAIGKRAAAESFARILHHAPMIWMISLPVSFLAVGLGILGLVFASLLALSYLGGWGALARTYAAMPEIDRGQLLEEKLQRKAWVGLNTFGRLVTARSFERGLELTVRFPFSAPLFFPWDEIHDYGRVNLVPFPQMDQFAVGGRHIRLSDHMDELSKHKG